MKKRYLLLLLFLGFLAVGEIGLELREYIRGYDSMLFGSGESMRISPHLQAATKDRFPIQWGSSNDPTFPFRSRYVTASNSKSNKKIWILSSSMAEDIYLPPSDIWPNMLELTLTEKKEGHYQVLNAAKVGMTIPDGLKKLQKYYHIYKPDIVIVYSMSNAINRLSRSLTNNNSVSSNEIKKKHWTNKIAENTTLYAKARNVIGTRIIGMGMLNNFLEPNARQIFVNSLEDIKNFCNNHKIKLIICTFATEVGPLDNISSINGTVGSLCFKYNSYLSAKGWVNTVRDWNEEIRFFAANNHIRLIDLANVLTGNKAFFRDYVHFTRKGHQEIAKLISAEILKENH